MKQLFSFLLLLFPVAFILAKPTVIKGVTNKPVTQLRVLIPSDPVSGSIYTAATTKTDFKGNFSLEFDAAEIGYVTLALGLYKSAMLVSPGGDYTLQLFVQTNSNVSYFDAPPLNIKILSSNDGGLSNSIEEINLTYNAFVLEHFNTLYRQGRTAYLDTLKTIIQEQVASIDEPYVTQYGFYKLASLEPLVKKMTIRQVFERYFKNKPILYSNPEYMSLFENHFSNYFVENVGNGTLKFMEAVMNGDQALKALITEDPILKQDEAFAELVLLYQLRAFLYQPGLPVTAVEKQLNHLSSVTKFSQHAVISQNMLRMFKMLRHGAAAPPFILMDVEGSQYSIDSSFKNIVLLNFLTEPCPLCETELTGIQKLSEKYGEELKLISIATKESFRFYTDVFKEKKYRWPLLNLDQNYDLLDAYNIRIFPENILLIQGGKIGMAPAPTRMDELENHITRLQKLQLQPN